MNKIFIGDCREIMRQLIADKVKVQMCVTSPPYYGLRDYNHPGQIGQESTPEEYIANLVETFSLVRKLMHDEGTLWINIGDSYAKSSDKRKLNGIKNKDLIGIPWMLAFALRADGWYLRADIIWHKPNVMPESVRDRCTKSHEYIFLLSKKEHYYYDFESIKEPCSEANILDFISRKNHKNKSKGAGSFEDVRPDLCRSREDYMPDDFRRNKRSVWSINTVPYRGAHFAVYPTELIEPCILAGSRSGDTVFDPFIGSGTTSLVAEYLNRKWIGIEINPEYENLYRERTMQQFLQM